MILTPSQLRLLLTLYSEQVNGGTDVRPPMRPDPAYADAAHRRLVQRGLVSAAGNLTPMGLREAHEQAERLRLRRR